jgi:hypothetical protein
MKDSKKLNIQLVKTESLVPYALNSKKHDAAQVSKIVASIKQFGWDQPIVVDKDMVIIKGHGRRLAALQLGLETVPVLVRDDLTGEQVRAARLADNRVALSDTDTEMLRKELATLEYDLAGIFESKEIDFSLADLGDINVDAFIDDVDKAVMKQEEETKARIQEIADKRIPLSKAFGFTDVLGKHEIYVNQFMSYIEHETGKRGEEALVHHISSLLSQ